MKRLIAATAILALAACGEAQTDDTATTEPAATEADASAELTGEAPGFEAVAPGTYEVTRSGGEVDFIEIHPGMTFSRVDADGAATGGSIYMKGGETCFVVEGQEAENCFTDGERQPDGSMETTSSEGNVSTIRPVSGSLEDHVNEAVESASAT